MTINHHILVLVVVNVVAHAIQIALDAKLFYQACCPGHRRSSVWLNSSATVLDMGALFTIAPINQGSIYFSCPLHSFIGSHSQDIRHPAARLSDWWRQRCPFLVARTGRASQDGLFCVSLSLHDPIGRLWGFSPWYCIP